MTLGLRRHFKHLILQMSHLHTEMPAGHSPPQGGVLLNVFQRLQRGPLGEEPASAERREEPGH